MQMYTTGYSLALKGAPYTEYLNINNNASVFLAHKDTNAKLRTFLIFLCAH